MRYTPLLLALIGGVMAGPLMAQPVQPPAQEPPAVVDENAPDPAVGTMPCRDFLALGPEEQVTAMSDAGVAPGESLAEPSPASEQAGEATVTACTENPDLTLIEAMKNVLPQ